MVTTVSATVLYMTRKRNLLFLLCGLSLCAPLLQAQEGMPTYPLSQLAEGIADGPAALRADLAQITLTEMAAEYAREAQQAMARATGHFKHGNEKSSGR